MVRTTWKFQGATFRKCARYSFDTFLLICIVLFEITSAILVLVLNRLICRFTISVVRIRSFYSDFPILNLITLLIGLHEVWIFFAVGFFMTDSLFCNVIENTSEERTESPLCCGWRVRRFFLLIAGFYRF